MAKKKKIDVGNISTLVSVLFGIIAVIMIFLPAIAIKDSETTYSGLQVAFGYTETTKALGLTVSAEIFAFSFMNLLTYVLAIVGVVFVILGYLGKGGKFAAFIATIAFALAAIFYFCSVAFCVVGADINSVLGALGGNLKDSFVLGAGSIIGGICSILAAITAIAKVLLK
jgi:hypothetical protein